MKKTFVERLAIKGRVLVPMEPTNKMIAAGVVHIRGYHGAYDNSCQMVVEAWRAMVEAASK